MTRIHHLHSSVHPLDCQGNPWPFYLFTYDCAGSFVAAWGLCLLWFEGFSLQCLLLLGSVTKGCAASGVAAHGCSSWEPHTRSTSSAAGQGLSCSVTCGIYLDQGSNRVPCNSSWILNPWPIWKSLPYFKLQPSSQDFLSPLLAIELVTNRLLFCLLSFPTKM